MHTIVYTFYQLQYFLGDIYIINSFLFGLLFHSHRFKHKVKIYHIKITLWSDNNQNWKAVSVTAMLCFATRWQQIYGAALTELWRVQFKHLKFQKEVFTENIMYKSHLISDWILIVGSKEKAPGLCPKACWFNQTDEENRVKQYILIMQLGERCLLDARVGAHSTWLWHLGLEFISSLMFSISVYFFNSYSRPHSFPFPETSISCLNLNIKTRKLDMFVCVQCQLFVIGRKTCRNMRFCSIDAKKIFSM